MSSRQQQLTGPDRWQISYADLITLLLGFFILMYAVSSMEADKKQAVITALENEFSTTGVKGPALEKISQDTDMGNIPLLAGSLFNVEATGEWLFLDVASEAVFESGSAKLMPSARNQLDMLARWLGTTDGLVEIEGHTDNQPINTAEFPNNWALSSARAVAIVNYLTSQHGLKGSRFRAVGFGEFAPVADNATNEGRQQNRRVVIKVENKPLLIVPNAGVAPSKLGETQKSPQQITFNKSGNNSNVDSANPVQVTKDNLKTLEQRLNQKGIDTIRLPSGGIKFSEGE